MKSTGPYRTTPEPNMGPVRWAMMMVIVISIVWLFLVGMSD